MQRLSLSVAALTTLAAAVATQGRGERLDFADLTPSHACTSPVEDIRMRAEVKAYARSPGFLPGRGNGPAGATQYPFYPMAGNPNADLTCTNYVDLGVGNAVSDWQCSTYAYNGHDASDALIRTFGEQDIGVPVFAALDGRVLTAVDGYPDRNVSWNNTGPANRVLIDHGGGHLAYYLHFKKGSVLVRRNQNVVAGQQIAMTGSSGRSSWPHLHFATRANNQTIEPFIGRCHSAQSVTWKKQPDFGHSSRVWDIGLSRNDWANAKRPPEPQATGGWVKTSDKYVYLWMLGLSAPPRAVYRFRWKRPNGTTALLTPNAPFNNAQIFRLWWGRWRWDIADMHTTTGRWTVEFEVNNVVQVSAPVMVTSGAAPGNRPPKPVSVRLDPAQPGPNDVVFCRVKTRLIDDEDYDIVRYRYRWLVSGKVVRDITHAGESDAIPRTAALTGDKIECIVTPSDGKVSGASRSARGIVGQSPWRNLGLAKRGSAGTPLQLGYGSLVGGRPMLADLGVAHPSSTALWIASTRRGDLKIFGGTIVPWPSMLTVPIATAANGQASLAATWPNNVPPGTSVFTQFWIVDPTVSFNLAASNALQATTR